MTAFPARAAALAAATALTLLMLMGIDGLARHPSQDGRLATLARPEAAPAEPRHASAGHGRPLPADETRG